MQRFLAMHLRLPSYSLIQGKKRAQRLKMQEFKYISLKLNPHNFTLHFMFLS